MNKKNILLALSLLYSFGLYSAQADPHRQLCEKTVAWSDKNVTHYLLQNSKKIYLLSHPHESDAQSSQQIVLRGIIDICTDAPEGEIQGALIPSNPSAGPQTLYVLTTVNTRISLAQCVLEENGAFTSASCCKNAIQPICLRTALQWAPTCPPLQRAILDLTK